MINDEKKPIETHEEEENFAELFEKSFKEPGRLQPGQKVEAKVLKISGDWVFIDTGRKGEGVLDRKELLDKEGNITVAEGDTVTAYFLSAGNNELRYTTKISGGGPAASAQLEEAWKSGIPVEGFVEKEIKGGYEVKVGGMRAFCPFSQMSLRRTDNPAEFIGKHLSFRISEFGERGRNIIVSHRAILEEERRARKEALRETLKEGQTVRGTVSSIRDFGAFVDIGGIEALIPVSEIAWGRVASVEERLSVGQEVEAVVKSADWEKDKISLSLRETLADPWQQAAALFPEGSYHTGTVVRLAPFGAFVSLGEGIDGLIHISKLGQGKRINHPRDVVKEGEMIEVKVEAVDAAARKISLAPAGPAKAADEEEKTMASFRKAAATTSTTSMGTLGDLLKEKLKK